MIKYELSDDFKALKNFDTPSITNAVATYPNDPKCLALYNAWKGKWYSDQTLKCMFPEVGRKAGYVVTVVYGPVRADQKSKYTLYDVFKAIENSPKPVCLAVKQDFPEDMKGINGLCGGMDVMPGDIVHMDENGACKFPPEYLHEVIERCKMFQEEESKKQKAILKAESADEIWSIFSGTSYGEK